MKCKKVKLLLGPYILGDLADDLKLSSQLKAHLQDCKDCTEEYQSIKQTIGFVEKYRDIFAEAFAEIDHERAKKAETRRLKLWVRISAVAACLIIGLLTLFIFSNILKQQPPSRTSSFSNRQAVSLPGSSVKVELISAAGKSEVSNSQQIASANQLQTLIINDKHRIIVNTDTILSVEPLVEGNKFGCTVILTKGEIYAHVEHDGNPFVVETANGKAVITGTTFDIKTTDNQTTLAVVEGTVEFASQAGSFEVKDGYNSQIIAQSAPTKPSLFNVDEFTVWATGFELKSALAKIESISPDYDLTDLWMTATDSQTDLEVLDYHKWVEQKREWFEREFSEVFKLQTALAKQGIEVDYPQLLITSGAIWQFVYPENSPQRMTVLSFDSLLKGVSKYNLDEQWIMQNIPMVKSLTNPSKEILTGQEAFQKWLDSFEQLQKSQTPNSALLLYSLHASKYLSNTRTLAWLYIANEQTDLTAKNKVEIMALLQAEVTSAEKIAEDIIHLFVLPENRRCVESNNLLEQVVENVTVIMEIEEKLIQYEASK